MSEDAVRERRTFIIATNLHATATSQHFRALSTALLDQGHRVVVVRQPEYEPIGPIEDRLAVHIWPSRRPIGLVDALFCFRLVRQYQPDCLLANFGAVNTMCAVGAAFGVRHRIAYYHTLTSQIDRDTDASPLRLRYVRQRKRWLYRLVTTCIANSEAARLDLTNSFGVPADRCRVWPLSLADPHSSLLAPYSQRSRAPLIVCPGRLQPSKGQDVLLKALPRLIQTIPNLVVEFVGDGPQQHQFMALAESLGVSRHCRFLGRLSQAEVMRRMAHAWVTVVPSRSEAFGLVNIESLAVGTPVVGSRVGGVPEIIRDGLDGHLVAPEEPMALAERLEALLLAPLKREQMEKNARSRFLEVFEQSKVVRQQANWLDGLLNKPNHSSQHQ